ncbi:uncharacterized protein LOC141607717 [Silene latifolia]|uniref:uncharacterized protein LOC141607717 n=1 Tax=Silene latifolia TaxID=37657 RepID=UPI003D772570
MDINGIQQPPTSTTLNSVCSMEINAIQQRPTSTTLISASSVNVVNGTPTCVVSSSSAHNKHPLILSFTSGGSEYWMRRVEMEFTPRLGMFFSSLAEAVLFYKVYALSCGFEPRLYTTKKNYEVVKYTRSQFFIIDKVLERVGMWKIRAIQGSSSQKLTRKLNAFHKPTIINNSKVNIGASTSFRLYKDYANGYENIGASLTEFKNFNRDVKCFIGGKDAQMVIDRFKEISKTTLLEHEDEESFKWCFEKILDAMNQKEPQCVITDQAPGLILVVPKAFKKARHCFCMWHIMQKVTVKVGPSICKDTDFLPRFNSVVWDITLNVFEFEFKWAEVINEFNLEDNSWLCSIYFDRAQWIPAYFTDLPMGCILRTTQRSKSANSFFKRFENKFGTLVEFLLRFKSVMDQQHYAQTCLDKDSDHSLPNLVSPQGIEKHASTVYTHAVFKEFQGEVETDICSCGVVGVTHDINHEFSKVGNGISGNIFRVVYSILTKDASCSCKLTSFADAHGTIDENSTHYHKLAVSNVWTEFYSIIHVLKSLLEGQVNELSCLLKSFRKKFCPHDVPMTKDQEMVQLLGCSSSSTGTILPPHRVKNKGKGKRMLSDKKKAIKPKRLCNNCKQMGIMTKEIVQIPFLKKLEIQQIGGFDVLCNIGSSVFICSPLTVLAGFFSFINSFFVVATFFFARVSAASFCGFRCFHISSFSSMKVVVLESKSYLTSLMSAKISVAAISAQ